MTRTIRLFTESDWPTIWPLIESVCREGETYTYPVVVDEATARALWIESPPGATVVLVDDGEILGTAKMGPPAHGLVGLHVMHLPLPRVPSSEAR